MNVGRTKIVSYAIAGFFAALGGLALTASTGSATVTGPYLSSRRGIVLGAEPGGGRGGCSARSSEFHLGLIRADLLFLGVEPLLDRHPGCDHGGRVMLGAS